ncbi:phosphoinositide 3-kinase regulatory subunit 6-like isoform X1 [Synchiropus splendidus]|uniref:phosphoinositide 3-kinase regulatory subunit 6-like isoform X1 n=1 Tax=Synchiropus splendidus TaxID=270530 RepID=UPI00237ED8C2|nr:phosphoinositide 3-kinase regulatory subunit 6-like isoform X1 [Synchiropus splendidus]XP_053712333.1 phosphoinositide 3-kinase regulatory subunit 6-like isoform X1 [Synchiropus splendidus]XP_053712334.1 phosphoinositide 3-kinase regulatory subunit 6-like isoform X1 [Synchiropus splendidus]
MAHCHGLSWQSPEPKATNYPIVPEKELYRSLQAILPKETDLQDTLNRAGMLRWTLHQKVKNNPANSLSLVWVLVKELEKAERFDNRGIILPLLHTIMYAIVQTAHIPDELYKRVYDICKRLLILPHPYCAIGLSYTRQIKAERSVPGLRYQRMVVAEQGLKNDYYPCQERVFVLADPDVFTGAMAEGLKRDIKASNSEYEDFVSPYDHMCSVVQHTLQAVLGEECNAAELARGLQATCVEPHFQEVLATVEQSAEAGGRDRGLLSSRLQQLYDKIVTGVKSECVSGGSLHDCPLPNPEMSFHMWTNDFDLWRELGRWLRSSSTDHFSLSQDQDDGDMDEMRVSEARHSVLSNDSGIVGDLPPGLDSPNMSFPEPPVSSTPAFGKRDSKLSRRGGMKMKPTHPIVLMQETPDSRERNGRRGSLPFSLQRRTGNGATQNPFPKMQRNSTARIVVMGDDRVLGRLAEAYYYLRKREARRLFLTVRANLQFYYIPVCSAPVSHDNKHQSVRIPCTVGSYLGRADPWYNCNVKSLGATLPQLTTMQPTTLGKPKEPFVSDAISYYLRAGQQPVYFTIYSVKIICTSNSLVEDVFLTHVELVFPDFHLIPKSLREKQRKSAGDMCGAVATLCYKEAKLSGRDTNRAMPVRTSAVQIDAIPAKDDEDVNCLTVTLKDQPAKTKNISPNPKIRTSEVKICAMGGQSITVTLDRDCRRTYKHVQSIEIFPCVDPSYSVQKTFQSKVAVGDEKSGLSKYMNKGLPLPINTFSGIIS